MYAYYTIVNCVNTLWVITQSLDLLIITIKYLVYNKSNLSF